MLPSALKYLYSVEPVRMHFPAKQPCTNDTVCNAARSIAHSIICIRLFRGKMHSDWFNGIEILQGRWQHGEKVGYCYPSGLEKTLCNWDIYVPLVTEGLIYIQQDATLHSLFYLETALHVSGGAPPIIRSANSTSSGICHTVTATCRYILAGSSNGVTNTRYCRYSCMRS